MLTMDLQRVPTSSFLKMRRCPLRPLSVLEPTPAGTLPGPLSGRNETVGGTEAVEERLACPGFRSHLRSRPHVLPPGGEDHVRFPLAACAGDGGQCVEGPPDARHTLIVMAVGVTLVLERRFGASAALEQEGSPPRGSAPPPCNGAFLGCESSAQPHRFTLTPHILAPRSSRNFGLIIEVS